MKAMKALIVLDNLDENIEELRADVKVNLYGETIGIYPNVELKPLPNKRNEHNVYCNWELENIINSECRGFNNCLNEILGEEE